MSLSRLWLYVFFAYHNKITIMQINIIAILVITLEEIRSREIIRASQDGNRKWVLLLAIVYVVVIKIPSILIYQRELRDWRNSCVEKVGNNTVYFAFMSTV